jgi:hypothetical protein
MNSEKVDSNHLNGLVVFTVLGEPVQMIDETFEVLGCGTSGAGFDPRGIGSIGVGVELVKVHLELVRLLEDVGDLLGKFFRLGLVFVTDILSGSERELFDGRNGGSMNHGV